MQLTLFPGMTSPETTRRRVLWRTELLRVMAHAEDLRVRDQRRQAELTGHLRSQISDLRARVTDLERGEGAADLARPPVRRAELRAFAGNGS